MLPKLVTFSNTFFLKAGARSRNLSFSHACLHLSLIALCTVAESQSSALKIVIFTFQEEFVINEDYKLTAHQMSQLWEEAGEPDDKEFLKKGALMLFGSERIRSSVVKGIKKTKGDQRPSLDPVACEGLRGT